MDAFEKSLSIITQIIPTIGVLFLVYNHFKTPDIQAAEEINKIKTTCPLKHEKLDYVINQIFKNMEAMNEKITLIQENDIKHIEMEMREMANIQTKILTILEYKEVKNNDRYRK